MYISALYIWVMAAVVVVCRCGLRVRTVDCDSTAGRVTIRGITGTPTPTPTLTPIVATGGPWLAVANHRVPMPDPTHGAPDTPPPLPTACPPSTTAPLPPTPVSQCFKAAAMSAGKKSPSLNKWVTGAELDAASTSMTIGAGRWDKLCPARGAVLRNFFR